MKPWVLILFGTLIQQALASDIGVYGRVYPIHEIHFLKLIRIRLASMEKNGELGQIQQRIRDRSIKQVNTPMPVKGLSHTLVPRHFDYDPTIEVPYAITDDNNQILVPKGTRVNPLTRVSFSKTWLFFDAREKGQVAWAKQKIKTENRIKLILVGGAIKETLASLHRRVYFDQQGVLIKKFGIRHVPAMVKQHGLMLRISEELPL